MAKRKSPEMRIVEFFETAPIEAAWSVLAVCQYTVQKRQPKPAAKPRAVKSSRTMTVTEAAAAQRANANG